MDLNSVGVTPFIILNMRIKEERLSKPDLRETSVTVREGSIRRLSA